MGQVRAVRFSGEAGMAGRLSLFQPGGGQCIQRRLDQHGVAVREATAENQGDAPGQDRLHGETADSDAAAHLSQIDALVGVVRAEGRGVIRVGDDGG